MVENLSEEPLLPQRKQAVRALLECKDPKEPDARGDIRHRANAINAVANLSRLIQGCRPQNRRSVARSKKHLTKPSPEPPAKSSKIYTFDPEHHCAFSFGDQRIAYESVHRFVRLKDIRKHISKKHADLHPDRFTAHFQVAVNEYLRPWHYSIIWDGSTKRRCPQK